MEKVDPNQSLNDAVSIYQNAKELEKEGRYTEAKEKYQLSAQFLVEIVNNTTKLNPKYREYKELAKEILTKAEKWKDKIKDETKRGITSYLFGKSIKKLPKKDQLMEEETKRRPTFTHKPNNSIAYPKPAPLSTNNSKPLMKPLKPAFPANPYLKPKVDPKPVAKKLKTSSVPKEVIDKLAENIIPAESSKITFSDIKGQKEVKKAIQDNIILPLMNPELFSGIREPSRAILLYGPPGNGKTLLAKALAGQIKRTFFNISASSLMSKFMGEGEKLMRGLFALAEDLSPSIIFFDEIDSMLCSRGSGEHEASRRMKTEFLVQFDGVGSSTNGDILIIAATNRPFDLDDAVLRRFTKRIFVGLPDREARYAIISHLFKEENYKIRSSEFKELIKSLSGYSSSDLTALWKEAAMNPINDYSPEELRYLKKSDIRPITYYDFMEAMKKVKPSYSRKKVQDFIDWEKSLGK